MHRSTLLYVVLERLERYYQYSCSMFIVRVCILSIAYDFRCSIYAYVSIKWFLSRAHIQNAIALRILPMQHTEKTTQHRHSTISWICGPPWQHDHHLLGDPIITKPWIPSSPLPTLCLHCMHMLICIVIEFTCSFSDCNGLWSIGSIVIDHALTIWIDSDWALSIYA